MPVGTQGILLALQHQEGIGRRDAPDYETVLDEIEGAFDQPTRYTQGIFLWLVAQCRYLRDFKHRVPDAYACMGLWFLYLDPERRAQGLNTLDMDRVALNVLVAKAEEHGRRIQAPGNEDSADRLVRTAHALLSFHAESVP